MSKRQWTRLAIGAAAAITIGLGVWAVVAGFVGGVIGATAAILGGALSAWYSSSRTAAIARQIQHQEVEDQALREFDELLWRVQTNAAAALDRDEPLSDYAHKVADQLYEVDGEWKRVLETRIRSRLVRNLFAREAVTVVADELRRARDGKDVHAMETLLREAVKSASRLSGAIRIELDLPP
jgi:hypothetical protein